MAIGRAKEAQRKTEGGQMVGNGQNNMFCIWRSNGGRASAGRVREVIRKCVGSSRMAVKVDQRSGEEENGKM